MLIAKKNSTNAFCVLTTTKYGMKEKTTTPKIIILLKIKIKKRIKKASSTTKDVYYYIPADQQQKSLFFLLNKNPIHFFSKQKQFSKINLIILPSFEKKISTKFFATVR